MTQDDEKIYNMEAAGKYTLVGRQALHLAIKKGKLKVTKELHPDARGRPRATCVFLKQDLDEYRRNKHCTDLREVEGKKIFDRAAGRWSVKHISKVLMDIAKDKDKDKFIAHKLYYLIRRGRLRANKLAGTWVVDFDEATRIFFERTGEHLEFDPIEEGIRKTSVS